MLNNSINSAILQINRAGTTAEELEAALTRESRVWIRKRLKSVAGMLRGGSCKSVAKELSASQDHVRAWVRLAAKLGWRALFRSNYTPKMREASKAKTRAAEPNPRLEADPATLRALANSVRAMSTQRRLRVVAAVAEGKSISAASVEFRVHEMSVKQWVKLYRQKGVEALHTPERVPKLMKLRPAQLKALAEFIRDNPGKSAPEIVSWLHGQYGVGYTAWGIRRVVVESLGFHCKDARFFEAAR